MACQVSVPSAASSSHRSQHQLIGTTVYRPQGKPHKTCRKLAPHVHGHVLPPPRFMAPLTSHAHVMAARLLLLRLPTLPLLLLLPPSLLPRRSCCLLLHCAASKFVATHQHRQVAARLWGLSPALLRPVLQDALLPRFTVVFSIFRTLGPMHRAAHSSSLVHLDSANPNSHPDPSTASCNPLVPSTTSC